MFNGRDAANPVYVPWHSNLCSPCWFTSQVQANISEAKHAKAAPLKPNIVPLGAIAQR
jgi:hypothetical protein